LINSILAGLLLGLAFIREVITRVIHRFCGKH